MRKLFQFVAVVTALAGLAQAADLAILRNGNSIRHERREVIGAVTRLYLNASDTGYIEIPTSEIERFEKDTTPIAKSAPAALQSTTPLPKELRASAPPMSRSDLQQVVAGAGERHQIDPDFINSVIRAESGFHQNAVSRKGAQGLMQLMPATASQLGVTNPFDPNANVEGGTKYLRDLLEKYNYDPVKALAAYNAGAKRVDQYHGVPPYYETQTYIARIIRDYNRQKIAENPALGRKPIPRRSGSAKTTHSGVVRRALPQTPTNKSTTSLAQQASR